MEDDIKAGIDNTPPMKIPLNLPSNAKLSHRFDTVLWLIFSVVTLYYTDLFQVLKTHPFTNELSFKLALFFGGLALSIAIYLIVWCSYIKGISPDDWETYNAYAIPIATATGLMSGLCWNIALWNVYGIKTPVITLVLFMGIIMLISLLPSWSTVEKNNPRQPLSNSRWHKKHGKVE